jgi:integrase
VTQPSDHVRTARSSNKHKLTPLLVSKVKPSERRQLVWDTVAKGLVLRIEPSGTKSWYWHFRLHNRSRWYRIGAVNEVGLSDARNAVGKLNALRVLDPAYDPQAEKVANRMQGTVADLVERYFADHLAGLKSGRQGAFLLRRFAVPAIGKLPMTGVSRSDIRTLLKGVASPTTRKQVHANISAMYNWAIRNDHLALAVNPATGIVNTATQSRERVLSDAEVPLFWAAFDSAGLTKARALRMILLTGQRPGEVRHMRWQDIKLGEHTLTDDDKRSYQLCGAWWELPGEPIDDGTWRGTKNGQTHCVWLSEPALQILEEMREELQPGEQPEHVFTGRTGKPIHSLDGAMRSICSAVGIQRPDKVTPHDLRRTHGTTITGLRFNRDAMNRIQNHREGGIAEVYDRHGYQHEAREIQEAVADRLMSLVNGQSGQNVIQMIS